jgi:Flp pilus assembly protein TadD
MSRGAIIQKGSILLRQGRYKEAGDIFKDGLSSNPSDDVLLYYLAYAQYHIPDQLEKALRTINEALKHQTEDPGHFWLKSLILADLDKHKEALGIVDQALALDPEYPQAHAAKAYIYMRMDKWADAEKHAKEALALDADDAFASSVLSSALRMQNKLDEGAQLAFDTLAKDPDDSSSHSNAGWIYLHKQNYPKAEIHFKEALRLDPNFESARIGMLEAFKARSLIYRWYLQYCLFMAQQSKTMRIVIIVGVYLAFRYVIRNFNALFSGPMVIVGYIVIVAMYLFFFWSWLAGGVGNLLVWRDKTARYALNKQEKLDAFFVGGGFFLGISLLAVAMLFKFKVLTILSIAIILSTVLLAVTFTNKNKSGAIFYGLIAAYMLLAGTVYAAGVLLYGSDVHNVSGIFKTMAGFALLLFILGSWAAAFGFLRK